MPMVMPPPSASIEEPNRNPSCGSGSRKISQTIRATAYPEDENAAEETRPAKAEAAYRIGHDEEEQEPSPNAS